MPTPVEYASLRRRLSSLLYECLLLLGVLAVGFLVPLIALGLAFGIEVAGWLEWLHVFVLLGAYFIWLWRRNGQTLAMQTWQLQLIDTRSGRTPTARQCLLRYLLAWPSTLLSLTGIGLIWTAFVDRDRQFIHDRLSGTAIIFNPRAQQEFD
jgi:uncharacterized RDD family membrane protein YckC